MFAIIGWPTAAVDFGAGPPSVPSTLRIVNEWLAAPAGGPPPCISLTGFEIGPMPPFAICLASVFFDESINATLSSSVRCFQSNGILGDDTREPSALTQSM